MHYTTMSLLCLCCPRILAFCHLPWRCPPTRSFGRFNRAFVSLFRIASGETWVDGLPFIDENGDISWMSSVFICSYIAINVWIVLQVLMISEPFLCFFDIVHLQ
jgi:hypothetical protein